MNDQLNTALRLVRLEVERIARALPSYIDADDLEADGYVGLVEANNRFDPQLGVPFDAFARRRVRGAIFDGIQRYGAFSRRECRRHRAARAIQPPRPTARPTLAHRHESRSTDAHSTPTGCAPRSVSADPEYAAMTREALAHIRCILESLPQSERELITAVYDLDQRGDSAAALARRRGVNRSSISRRKQRTLARMRHRLLGHALVEPDFRDDPEDPA